MCTSILSGRSYVIEILEGNPQVCYNIFRMNKTIFRHLCNELKRLHLLEEDTSIVSVEEVVGTVLFIVGHNADYRLTANRFQHSLETIHRRFRRALRAIHALGCLIIRPDANAAKLPHSLRGNEKYYPWFESLDKNPLTSKVKVRFEPGSLSEGSTATKARLAAGSWSADSGDEIRGT
ncbi:hypothetical protein CFP56_008235 [Quercus suber]|uniref:DUF8040 domain-containing protein n=1 Tax=Quercus suber TaxID=58331 RepID=A0AAW0L5Y0_QUESU|nr:hypothetical protein CFP56_68921 [Quercus suber]